MYNPWSVVCCVDNKESSIHIRLIRVIINLLHRRPASGTRPAAPRAPPPAATATNIGDHLLGRSHALVQQVTCLSIIYLTFVPRFQDALLQVHATHHQGQRFGCQRQLGLRLRWRRPREAALCCAAVMLSWRSAPGHAL